jgi:DNA-binding NarL/FixJ family response regulator
VNRKKRRIFIVDDHPIVRHGMKVLIDQEPDLATCGEAEDGRKALADIRSIRPDLLIIDISLAGMDGLELVKHVHSFEPTIPVLIVSMHDETLYAERALRAGARGYVMKQEPTERILLAIRRVLAGETYVSDKMASIMLNEFLGGASAVRSPLERLSDRELEVFRLIGKGLGTRQIAEKLHLSIKTIESYRAHIKEKLRLKDGAQLVQQAVHWLHGETNR